MNEQRTIENRLDCATNDGQQAVSPGKPLKVAVFDVCGTLYDSNTTYDFLEFYWRRRNRLLFLYARAFRTRPGRYTYYALARLLKIGSYRMRSTRLLKGAPLEQIQRDSADFVATFLEGKKRPEIVALLEHYRREGYHIVLLSGSYACIIEHVARRFQVDDFRASELASENGFLTGSYANDVLHQKAELFADLYPDVAELVVVTDNRTDVALLKMAASGYAVCKKQSRDFWAMQQLPHIQLIEV